MFLENLPSSSASLAGEMLQFNKVSRLILHVAKKQIKKTLLFLLNAKMLKVMLLFKKKATISRLGVLIKSALVHLFIL